MDSLGPRLVAALKGTEFEGQTFFVGGCVRDRLLGLSRSPDLDIVTVSDAQKLAGVLNSKGLLDRPPIVFPRFLTAMVSIDGRQVELTTARSEDYDPKSRKPSVRPASLDEDAVRRDFTINALYQSLDTRRIIDPLGRGMADLNSKVLRTPIDPTKTFFDDPLRMMRAVRFRSQLGFTFDSGLVDSLKSQSGRMAVLSHERIRDELVKILHLPRPSGCLQELVDLDLMPHVFACVADMCGCEQGGVHHKDVWGHTLDVIDLTDAQDLVLRLAALLHDCGKPAVKSIDPDGRVRFLSHETVGAKIAAQELLRLRFPKETVHRVAHLVRHHMRAGSAPILSSAAARRIIRDLGPQVGQWLSLVEADSGSLLPGNSTLDMQTIRSKIAEVQFVSSASQIKSPLTGQEIMEATGLGPGPEVGRLKSLLDEDVVEGRLKHDDKSGAYCLLDAHARNSHYNDIVS